MRLLEGKVGLITGAASGIGKYSAIICAREGSSVVVSDISRERGEKTVAMIKEAGGEAVFFKADVANEENVRNLVEYTVDTYGKLDWACNNAAVGGEHISPVENLDDAIWQKTLSVTLMGVFYCIKHEYPAMLNTGQGSIINISSLAGVHGTAYMGAYAAAKGGVQALTKTAAAEFATKGVRVNAICPAAIATGGLKAYLKGFPEMEDKIAGTHAMRRLGKPEEVGDAVAFLASDRSTFITGHSLMLDGGSLVNTVQA